MWWIVLLVALLPGIAWGACEEYTAGHWYPGTYAAQSLTRDDVQSCLDAAGFDAGDTVHLKAGTADWATGISFKKHTHLIGAGKTATIITYTETRGGESYPMISMGRYDGSSLTDMKLVYPAGTAANYMVTIGGAKNFVIQRVHFYRTTYLQTYGVFAKGTSPAYEPNGLIAECDFENGPRVMIYASAQYDIATSTTPAVQWADQTIRLGSIRAVYIEDSTFVKSGFGNQVDAEYGGSFVFRYNSVTGGSIDCHGSSGTLTNAPGTQTHTRGTRYWEAYHNMVDGGTSNVEVPVFLRGGTGVLFNNTFSGVFASSTIKFDTRRVTDSVCDGTKPADGNLDAYGYPCRDQIGMGYDSSLWTAASPYPAQVAQPAYVWSNTWTVNVSTSGLNSRNTIVKNRDYYETDATNCPTAGTTCTAGVGVGTKAQLNPTVRTCTAGVGFWVTDEGYWNSKNDTPVRTADGVLYKCVGGVWTLYYVPYPYPHPLRSGLSAPGVGGN